MGSVAERNVVSGSLSLRCGVYRQQLSLRGAKRRGNPPPVIAARNDILNGIA